MTNKERNSGDQPQNQNNEMSEDPRDGSRESFVIGRDGARTAAEKAPEEEQEESAIKAFGEEGAGIAAKE